MPKKRRYKRPNYVPRILIVVGVLALVIVLLLIKAGNKPQAQTTDIAGDLPAAQLQNALAEHHPTLAFFHSNNCQQCITMIGIVEQVYPEYSDVIRLVDVNVYDERNAPLLQQVGLQYIPTLIFYDRAGKSQVSVGVMEAELLRQTLAAMAGGD
jgi:thioredoxin-like negative regulator of GroEL